MLSCLRENFLERGEFSVSLDESSYLGTAEQLGNIFLSVKI
jgi:hypothetical protein